MFKSHDCRITVVGFLFIKLCYFIYPKILERLSILFKLIICIMINKGYDNNNISKSDFIPTGKYYLISNLNLIHSWSENRGSNPDHIAVAFASNMIITRHSP